MKNSENKYMEPLDEISQRPARTYWEIVRKQFLKDKLAVIGLVLIIMLFAVAIYAPFIANDRPFVLHKSPVEEYSESWEGMWGLIQDISARQRKIEEAVEKAHLVALVTKDYEKTQKNQITLDEICQLIKKGETDENIQKQVHERRAEPLKIEQGEEDLLNEASASPALIQALKSMDTKFDRLSLAQVLQLMEKSTPLEEIKRQFSFKRVNPFYISMDMEDKIKDAFKKAYSKVYTDPQELQQNADWFLNYLSSYKMNLAEEIKDLKNFEEGKYIASLQIPVDESLKNFADRAEEMEECLSSNKNHLVRGILKKYTSCLNSFKENKVPSRKQIESIEEDIEKLKLSEEPGGVITGADLPIRTVYPILKNLTPNDIFFMVLFIVFLISPILFYFVEFLPGDSFQQFFLKIIALFLFPTICTFLWWQFNSPKQDKHDYRKIVKNLKKNEYDYIQPIFYGPNSLDSQESQLPPSWVAPSFSGIQSLKSGNKFGKLIIENFEVQYLFSIDRSLRKDLNQEKISLPLAERFKKHKISLSKNAAIRVVKKAKEWEISDSAGKWIVKEKNHAINVYESGSSQSSRADQIQSAFLAPLKEKMKQFQNALEKDLKEALLQEAKKMELEFFITPEGSVKSEYASLGQGSARKKLAKEQIEKLDEYESLYSRKKNALVQTKYSGFSGIEKELASVNVVKDFANFNQNGKIIIPENKIVFLNADSTIEIRNNIYIEPGAVLVIPAAAVEFNYSPPSLWWFEDDASKLPNYHFFGTDDGGKDVFTRMVWGARISLSVGFVAVGIYVFIGIVLGSLAGYFGGRVDLVISRLIEVMICFPTLVLLITVIAVMPRYIIDIWSGMFAIMVVIGLTGWTGIARLIRGEFLRLRNLDFVVAGKALGVSNLRLIFRHIVPNALAPVLVSATFGIASAILTESMLSFLGLGVSPPTPTWGEMLSAAQGKPLALWWLTFYPGFAIFFTVTIYNLVGEGIRDALDPRLKER